MLVIILIAAGGMLISLLFILTGYHMGNVNNYL